MDLHSFRSNARRVRTFLGFPSITGLRISVRGDIIIIATRQESMNDNVSATGLTLLWWGC